MIAWNSNGTATEQQRNNKKKDKKVKNDKNVYKDIVEYLNQKCNKNFKHSTKATQRFINARLNEGFTLDDFKKVIDNKCSQWLNDTKMNKFLRPETLFSNKFEGYLNERGDSNGTDKSNSKGNTNEVNRLKKLAIEEGLINPDGTVEDIGEIDF